MQRIIRNKGDIDVFRRKNQRFGLSDCRFRTAIHKKSQYLRLFQTNLVVRASGRSRIVEKSTPLSNTTPGRRPGSTAPNSPSRPNAAAPPEVTHRRRSARGISSPSNRNSSSSDNASFDAKESVPTQIFSPLSRNNSTGGRRFEMYRFDPGQRHHHTGAVKWAITLSISRCVTQQLWTSSTLRVGGTLATIRSAGEPYCRKSHFHPRATYHAASSPSPRYNAASAGDSMKWIESGASPSPHTLRKRASGTE